MQDEIKALVAQLREFDGDYYTRFAGKTMCENSADHLERLAQENEALRRGRDEWRSDFRILEAAVVGDTGLSAITVAAQAREHRACAEAAEARVAELEVERDALKEEYRAFEREVEQREKEFARKMGVLEARAEAAEARVAELEAGRGGLTVWHGEMPESNGRRNWTASLHRKGGDAHVDGFCFARSEYPDRVKYEADRMRWIIGERKDRPDIMAYDSDKHSGHTEPTAITTTPAEAIARAALERAVEQADEVSTICENKCRELGGVEGRTDDFKKWFAKDETASGIAVRIRALAKDPAELAAIVKGAGE